jgi:hypothetical protein
MVQPRGRGALRTDLNLTLSPAQRSQAEENDQLGAPKNHEEQTQQLSFQVSDKPSHHFIHAIPFASRYLV